MPITTHRNLFNSLTTFECKGSLSLNEIVVVIERFFQGDVAPPTKNILWDMQTASIDTLTEDHAYQIGTLVNSYRSKDIRIKVAVVVSMDIDFERAEKVKKKSNDDLKIIRVFRHIDEAEEWLNSENQNTEVLKDIGDSRATDELINRPVSKQVDNTRSNSDENIRPLNQMEIDFS